MTGLKMIGLCNCPITGVRLEPTVRLHCPFTTLQIKLMQNTAVNAPISFEEIVMVMIIMIIITISKFSNPIGHQQP